MRAITPLGWGWEMRHSLWMIFILTPYTLPISYFYVGIRIMSPRWIFIGFVYLFLVDGLIYVHWRYMTGDGDLVVFTVIFIILTYLNGVQNIRHPRRDYLFKLYDVMEPTKRDALIQVRRKRKQAKQEYARSQKKLTRTEIKKRQSKQTAFVRTERELNAPLKVVNVNQANVEELARIPGVGHILAEKILAKREAGIEFTSFEQLVENTGIRAHRFLKAKEYLACTDGSMSKMQAKLEAKLRKQAWEQENPSGRSIDF